MSERNLRCVIVASTGGAVMNVLLGNAFFKSQIFAVISDRDCGAVEKAGQHRVPVEVIRERNSHRFCDQLLVYLQANQVDYVISFFTRLFVGELVAAYADRIINLHPSLLPAFKGLDGFGDALRYGVRYIGTTIHFVDEHMDEGKIIMQTVCPADLRRNETALRHRIFRQQCQSLLQVVKWLADGRVQVEGQQVTISGAAFDDGEFVPNLDFDQARELMI